jgi:signal peptidase II
MHHLVGLGGMIRLRFFLIVLFALATVGCDHATKELAVSHFRLDPLEFFQGSVLFTYAENRDMAFNLLGPLLGDTMRLWMLSAAKLLAVVGGSVLLLRKRATAKTSELLGVALFVAGALGNLADRVVRGFVVDFVKVPHWPVFNVADVAICVGLGLLMLRAWRKTEVVPLTASSHPSEPR